MIPSCSDIFRSPLPQLTHSTPGVPAASGRAGSPESISLRYAEKSTPRSNRLILLTAGLRVHECQECLSVVRTDGCEFHSDSLSIFRPPHDSLRSYCGQLGHTTEDQVELSTNGEHCTRTEAKPRAAHVFSIQDVGSRAFRQSDSQGCYEPRSGLPFFYYCGHGFCTLSMSSSPRCTITFQKLRIRPPKSGRPFECLSCEDSSSGMDPSGQQHTAIWSSLLTTVFEGEPQSLIPSQLLRLPGGATMPRRTSSSSSFVVRHLMGMKRFILAKSEMSSYPLSVGGRAPLRMNSCSSSRVRSVSSGMTRFVSLTSGPECCISLTVPGRVMNRLHKTARSFGQVCSSRFLRGNYCGGWWN